MINATLISYGCIFKRLSKPAMKGSRIATNEKSRKEHKNLLEEGRGNLIDSIVF